MDPWGVGGEAASRGGSLTAPPEPLAPATVILLTRLRSSSGDPDLGLEIAKPDGVIAALPATALDPPARAAAAFARLHGLSAEDAADIATLIAPRLHEAAAAAAVEARTALLDCATALDRARLANESTAAWAPRAAAFGVEIAELRAQLTAARAATDAADTRTHLAEGERDTAIAERDAAAAAANIECVGLRAELERATRAASTASARASTAESELSAMRAVTAEAAARSRAWGLYVDGPVAGADPLTMSRAASADDRRSLEHGAASAAVDDGSFSSDGVADRRSWIAEKRALLAAANRDRAALIAENKKLRAALAPIADARSLHLLSASAGGASAASSAVGVHHLGASMSAGMGGGAGGAASLLSSISLARADDARSKVDELRRAQSTTAANDWATAQRVDLLKYVASHSGERGALSRSFLTEKK